MKIHSIPKSQSDIIATILSLANENEELKKQVKELQDWVINLQSGIHNLQ